MKPTRWVKRVVLAALLVLSSAPHKIHAGSSSSGMAVLIMSDNRSRDWTRAVRKMMRDTEMPCPYQIFFGNGDSSAQFSELRTYVRDLEDEGATTIVVVPLLTSSNIPAYKQWRYLLNQDNQPGYNNATFFPIKSHVSIRFAEPLNDSSVVVEILLDRIQELSANRTEENVVIIAQGAADDYDNTRYLQTLQGVAQRVKQRGGFRSVMPFTLREDASTRTRQAAMQILRTRIESMNENNQRVLIVSMILTESNLEHRLGLELRGLSYVLNTKPLFPDSRIAEWIRSQVP